MPTDKSDITTERQKMNTKHGIVPKAAYDLILKPLEAGGRP
jgi:hypothetical protein